tara:strand:- start:6706 stop:7245 length:540 start_codon:yes stop_codon:yes gene_type:complete
MKKNEDDECLFKNAMKNVTPIKKNKRLYNNALSNNNNKISSKAINNQNYENSMLELDISADEVKQLGNEITFRRKGVPKQVLSKLKKGDYYIESEIDLHGYTVHQAKTILKKFIANSSSEDIRCVKVIHGKGLGSGINGPIIKNYAQRWLAQWADVLAFVKARAKDGGSGALYVLIKKR